MRRIFLFIILTLASLTLASDDKPNPFWIVQAKFIRAEIYAPEPLTLDGKTSITSHLINIDTAPVLLNIQLFSCNPRYIDVKVPAAFLDLIDDKPNVDQCLDLADFTKIQVSGLGIYGMRGWQPYCPEREGIILLKDEGYARIITFLPRWLLDSGNIPSRRVLLECDFEKEGRYFRKQEKDPDHLIVNVIHSIEVSTPALTRDAVTPGKCVVFNAPYTASINGDCSVPFKRSCGKSVEPDEKVQSKDFDLRAIIEVPAIEAGKDIPVTYLIGNHSAKGAQSIYIWQNALVPALATFEVLEGDKIIATIDGSALRGMLDLLPKRLPIPLNPGEYLTYRRVLPTNTLPLKRDATYQLRLRIDAQWLATEPAEHDQPQIISLLTTTTLQMKK